MKHFYKPLLLLLTTAVLLLGGCGVQQTASEQEKNITAENNAVFLAAGRNLAPGEKDGYYCSKILGVWEPLITKDENGLPKPCLATGWEMKDGGKEWIFHLRRGVQFHNGSPFNADAVIKNFERMKLGVKRSSFYGLDIKTFYPSLIRYEKIDDYTLKFLFAEPNVNQLYKMIDFGSPVYAPECFAPDGNFQGFAIGTGPYKITENVLNKYVRLTRSDTYYGTKAKVPEIVVRNIPNPDVRYAALKAGEILGVLDINAIPPFLAEEIKQDDRFAISTNKSTMIRFLALNGSRFPFNDVRMRQAVSLAIDRKDLVQALYLNYAEPTANLLNYTSPYYKDYPVEYDPEKARKLAREVLGGQRCEVVYCINGGEPLQKGEAELISYWLQSIGLDVTIQSLEYATMARQMRRGDYDIARVQQGLPNGDPYSIFYTFMMPDGSRNKISCLAYQNHELAALLQEAKHCTDENKRRAIYDRLQLISIEDQPVVPLFNDRSIVAYSKRLKNYDALVYGVNLAEIELID